MSQLVSGFAENGDFFGDVFNLTEYKSGDRVSIGSVKAVFSPVRHYVPSFAVSLSGSSKLVYSSDSGTCDELLDVARGADLFLCTVGRCLGAHLPNLWGHLLPSEAGEIAAKAGARNLLITHFWPTCSISQAVREATASFGKRAIAARPNRSHTF